jgi:anthranilate synthase component 1
MNLSLARGFLLVMKQLPKIKITQKPTYVKMAEDVDFFALFEKIEQEFGNCFLFESLGEEGKFARYSMIGFDPAHVISAREKTLFVDGEAFIVDNPYFALREMMPAKTIAREYAGGFVGYLSYEAVNYFEPSVNAKIHADFDQFMFGVYTDGVIFDKLTNELFYFYYTSDRSDVLKNVMQAHVSKKSLSVRFGTDGLTKKEHAEIVEQVKEQIFAGNIFQCEVGFKSTYTIKGNPLHIYEKLRQTSPSPFMYYVKFGDKKIIGASPELLFSLRDGEMTTKPLAGTSKRGKTEAEDQKLARMLLNDPKEIAEHMMLVDLHRNDIGRVAKFGTVKVRELMNVKKFSFVQHISSEIVGLLSSKEDVFSAFVANFPAGTLTGAPKIEAMKIINANEKEARGPYGGAVGHFGFNGDCTFAIAIRSLFVSGENAYTQTCGGIVSDSKPENEYQEIQNKKEGMRNVLQI